MSAQTTFSTAQILLVEDNPADVRLVEEALRECGYPHNLRIARDGIEALDLLRDTTAAELPHLILLDLNLPRKDGIEVLQEIKKDQHLMHIPVVVLTTSTAARDINTAYRCNANSYVAKPSKMPEFFEMICKLEEYWFQTAMLPVASDSSATSSTA